MLRTKSVWSKIKKKDGLRILATRFRGRGLTKDRCDVWMANLGPSELLLHDFQQGNITWSAFKRQYSDELWADSVIDKGNKTIMNRGQKFTLRLIKHLASTGNVTLMCHCDDDAEYCHLRILKKFIKSKKI